ncbi:RHS repeat-associated core domain-containing protein, partial [Aliikangiella maris]
NRFRYYDARNGRFTSQDPIGLLGGSNQYRYVPNPLSWIDPLGLSCKENSWNIFQKNTKGHFVNSTEASKSYQRMKEVEAMDKMSRPENVESYLPQSFIDNHLKLFNQQGGAFIAIQGWIRNPKYKNYPPRKFVGLRSEMDEIISRYEASGKDWTILRDELSLGEGVDLSSDQISYIIIQPNDPRFSYDIPNGKEAGAYDGEWVPGGKTKGQTTEAALVGAENIKHDNKLSELEKQFPGSKRIR